MSTISEIEALLAENAADEKTQQARIASLKGKNCLWVTAPCIPGMSQSLMRSVKWANSQGVNIIAAFSSSEDKVYKIMEKEGLFTHAIFAEYSDSDKTTCENIVQKLKEDFPDVKIDGAFSPYEGLQTLIGELVDILGLPGNHATSYRTARSKYATREVTKAAGLATPRAGVAYTREELKTVTDAVGFPCIVKPSSGAGSGGVMKAHNFEEALKAFSFMEEEIASNAMLAYNPGCKIGALCEQFLEGEEFDVDLLFWNGECVYKQLVHNWPGLAPFFLETGTLMPGDFSAEYGEPIVEYAINCVKALKFTQGCFHVEVMNTPDGPVLIEVNSRQGGGPNQVFNLEMTEVDVFANFFMAAMGIPINPPRVPHKCAMGDYLITSPVSGILVEEDFMAPLKLHPNIFATVPYLKKGDKVMGIDSGFPEWMGNFTVKADNAADVSRIIKELVIILEDNIRKCVDQTQSVREKKTVVKVDTAAKKEQSPEENTPPASPAKN